MNWRKCRSALIFAALGLIVLPSVAQEKFITVASTTSNTYYPDGLLATVTNPLGGTNNTVTYTYDSRGRLSTASDSSPKRRALLASTLSLTWTAALAAAPALLSGPRLPRAA